MLNKPYTALPIPGHILKVQTAKPHLVRLWVYYLQNGWFISRRHFLEDAIGVLLQGFNNIEGVISHNEMSKKRIKWFIEMCVCVLMDTGSKEATKVVFGGWVGESTIFLIFFGGSPYYFSYLWHAYFNMCGSLRFMWSGYNGRCFVIVMTCWLRTFGNTLCSLSVIGY